MSELHNGNTCGNCKHWLRHSIEVNDRYGHCYRYPPTVVAMDMLPQNPKVKDNRRACGEHAALEPGQEAAAKAKVDPPQRGDRVNDHTTGECAVARPGNAGKDGSTPSPVSKRNWRGR